MFISCDMLYKDHIHDDTGKSGLEIHQITFITVAIYLSIHVYASENNMPVGGVL